MDNKHGPQTPGTKSGNERPEWMPDDADDGFAEYLAAVEPDIVAEWTRFVEAYPPRAGVDPDADDSAHLFKLIQASFFRQVETIPDWKDHASGYPLEALSEEELKRTYNDAVRVRGHYLKAALTRLLTIVGAPEAMILDLQAILDEKAPRSADLRAEAQLEWSKSPQTSLRAIASKQKRNHGQLYKDKKAGLLFKPSAVFAPNHMENKKKNHSE